MTNYTNGTGDSLGHSSGQATNGTHGATRTGNGNLPMGRGKHWLTPLQHSALEIERKKLEGSVSDHPPKMAHIMTVVARHYGTTRQEMLGPWRDRNLVNARWMAVYLCREMTWASYPAMAKAFSRDHSTLVHGVNMARAKVASDRKFAAFAAKLRAEIQGEVDALVAKIVAETGRA